MDEQPSASARFHAVTESPHAGVIGSDETGFVRYCSPQAAALFGMHESDVIGAKVADLILTGADPATAERLDAVGQRADGTTFPLDLTVVTVRAGATSSLVWIVRERSSGDVELEDPLTLLPNRRFCLERIRERLEHASLNQRGFAMFVVALEGIDDLNRRAGRHAGDAALVEAASRLRHAIASADLIGRLGSAEFCVLTQSAAGAAELEALADSVVESMALPFDAGGEAFAAAASVGVAVAPADGSDADALLGAALTALDRARHDGAHVRFHSRDLDERLRHRRSMQDRIRRALDEDWFSLDFLPVINLGTSLVDGAEALLRWREPDGRTIAPMEFIPTAEESGLMIPIGNWVMREALRHARRWNAGRRRMRVAVNVSARQLNAPGFIRQLGAALALSGCKPDWLELEITESTAMANAATVQLTLAEVRAAGVRTALDDFGTGYSSMAYLKSIPVDVIKIDRSFVDGVPTDNSDSSIVRAIVAFALCTGREVRAEGVTSMEQARWLHAEGCDAAQGFFFSKPIPAEEFEAWLDAYESEAVLEG